jgi:hypothetical protein
VRWTLLVVRTRPLRRSNVGVDRRKSVCVGHVKHSAGVPDRRCDGTPALRLTCPTVCSVLLIKQSLTAGLFHEGDVLFGEGADPVHITRGDRLFFNEC